jgi:hypothetical protein
MRIHVGRQRKEILQLQRAGIPTASAELLLATMLAKIDGLCAGRERLKKEQGGRTKGCVLGGRKLVMGEPLKWYNEKADNPSWIDALAELRRPATCEGHCIQHVQAITIAIDQYSETALGNRDYFLNKHYGVG